MLKVILGICIGAGLAFIMNAHAQILELEDRCILSGCVWDGIEKTMLFEKGLSTDITYEEYIALPFSK